MRKSSHLSKNDSKGFTLVEMLFALTISMFVMAIGLGSILFLSRGLAATMNYADMNNKSRYTMEVFGQDVRMGLSVHSCTVNEFAFDVPNEFGSLNWITYTYDSSAKTLSRTVNGNPAEIMLRNVRDLEFRYYTFRHNLTTTPLEVKEVQIEVIMEKSTLQLAQTNHIISAQFMMRNKSVTN